MKVLVSVDDAVVKDQIQVGLEAFESLEVEFDQGVMVLDRIRRCDYGFLILSIRQARKEEIEFLDRITEANGELELLVAAPANVIKRVKEERPRGQIFGFIETPLQAVDFFRAVSRTVRNIESGAARS